MKEQPLKAGENEKCNQVTQLAYLEGVYTKVYN